MIAALPRVKDNTGSPFFQAGKLSGARAAAAGWLLGCWWPAGGRRLPVL